MSFPATASYPSVAAYPGSATYPASAAYPPDPIIWTPVLTSPLLYWDGRVGQGGVFKDSPGVTPCADGDPCETLAPLYSSSLTGTQLTLLNRPIAHTDGLEFDTSGLDNMTPGSFITLDPTVGFTAIGVFNNNNGAGASVPLLGSLTGSAFFGMLGGAASFLDDNGDAVQATATAAGLQAVWVDCDATGNVTMRSTDDAGAGTATLTSNSTFNQFGTATGLATQNDLDSNRYVNVWIIPRDIDYSSPEAAQIRTWVAKPVEEGGFNAILPFP